MSRHVVTLVVAMTAAKILSLAGSMVFPGLLPMLQGEWNLTNTEAGWINGAFSAGYGFTVPVLVGLTDRFDARRIYLFSAALGALAMLGFAVLAEGFWTAVLFRVLIGVSFAGTYMPGLKLLGERLSGSGRGRAISFYAGSGAIGMALSVFWTGLGTDYLDWRWMAALTGLGPLVALALVASVIEGAPKTATQASPVATPVRVLDFRPAFRNRGALGYMLGYAVHCWEMLGFWGWVVAYLSFALTLSPDPDFPFSPQEIAAVVLLIGWPASILGNEGAIRWGRRRAISAYMLVSVAVGLMLGFSAGLPFVLVALLAVVYGALTTSDSGSLTVGLYEAARPGEQGRTMAVYSSLGFTMAFLAPLAFGGVLDLAGGGAMAWGLAFTVLVALPLTGPLWLYLFGGRQQPAATREP
ncbi:MAG: MFS transporter [Alphaproteobacteria bacterium]